MADKPGKEAVTLSRDEICYALLPVDLLYQPVHRGSDERRAITEGFEIEIPTNTSGD